MPEPEQIKIEIAMDVDKLVKQIDILKQAVDQLRALDRVIGERDE